MKRYYFTFGCGEDDPHRNCYTVIEAESYEKAREIMFSKYGSRWAFQYDEDGWILDPKKDKNFALKARLWGIDTNRTEPITQAELYRLTEIK